MFNSCLWNMGGWDHAQIWQIAECFLGKDSEPAGNDEDLHKIGRAHV